MLYAVISPAKKLDFSPVDDVLAKFKLETTQPVLLKDAGAIATAAKKLSTQQIQRLMDLSPKLAELNYDRFQAFEPANRKGTKAAIYAFAGDVYMGLDAKTLDKADVAFAQKHVGIISGLYGLLRPLDAMQPYRMEMGSRLANPDGADLYAFWRHRLTAHLNAITGKLKTPTIVNLASNEYWSAVKEKDLKAPVLHVAFKEIRNNKPQIISFLAKKARGMMARAIVENRWEQPVEMQGFNADGYRFDAATSDETHWVFSRKAK